MSLKKASGDKLAKGFICRKPDLFCGIKSYPRADSTGLASIPASSVTRRPREHLCFCILQPIITFGCMP
jgi:hypothetical protein